MIIEGNVRVKAALLANKREIKEIWVNQKKKDRDTHFILAQAKEKNIPVFLKNKEEISSVANGKTHGGLIAFVKERRYESFDSIRSIEMPFFVFVEGVEDPFNLGYIMRSLYSAGCDALVLPKRNWGDSESVMLKSSAGAFEYMHIVMSENPLEDLSMLKEKGCSIYAAMRKDAISYTKANLKRPLVLLIGGEMRGLSSSILQLSEQNIYIPYANDFRNALNAASAVAILAYEVLRQQENS